MKIYLLSLAVGLLVGVLYGLLHVRSPAPPVVALIGLLGILLGEQIPPLLRQVWHRQPATQSWERQVRPHVFGSLPCALPTFARGARPDGAAIPQLPSDPS
mgnify:CR=1 FL=1